MDKSGALYVAGAEALKPTLKRLTDCAVARRIPIVGSVDAHVPDDPEFDIFPPHCVVGTPGQKKIPETTTKNMNIVPNARDEKIALNPGGQIILEKRIYSLFDNVNSSRVIRSAGRRTFIVYGVALDYCVKAAAEGLLDRAYAVHLVEDATAPVDKKGGERAIAGLKEKGIRLASADDVIG
jgi:nicotinamidase/pyrazinamidase